MLQTQTPRPQQYISSSQPCVIVQTLAHAPADYDPEIEISVLLLLNVRRSTLNSKHLHKLQTSPLSLFSIQVKVLRRLGVSILTSSFLLLHSTLLMRNNNTIFHLPSVFLLLFSVVLLLLRHLTSLQLLLPFNANASLVVFRCSSFPVPLPYSQLHMTHAPLMHHSHSYHRSNRCYHCLALHSHQSHRSLHSHSCPGWQVVARAVWAGSVIGMPGGSW